MNRFLFYLRDAEAHSRNDTVNHNNASHIVRPYHNSVTLTEDVQSSFAVARIRAKIQYLSSIFNLPEG